jgi:hypothetical protein
MEKGGEDNTDDDDDDGRVHGDEEALGVDFCS